MYRELFCVAAVCTSSDPENVLYQNFPLQFLVVYVVDSSVCQGYDARLLRFEAEVDRKFLDFVGVY